jgi:uncharacterized protein
MNDSAKTNPWLPYVAPMALYFAFLAVQTNTNLVWLYPVKTVAVAGVIWWFRRSYDELKPPFCRTSAPLASAPDPTAAGGASALQLWSWGIAAGLVAIAIWIGIDPFYPKLSAAAPFDPRGRYVFIAFRIVGAVVVVPLMEELFWRAFLIRWLVKDDFKSVPVGTFTWRSFVITVALFGLEHNQWLAGLICGAIYNMLLYRTRSVWACVVAHATSNAALAAWVLARGDWKFW